ncbi:hypothetical protein [Aliidiomarina indica]|uniref:hypothetical protein n=1 Tax=Aliidiomarina indica TaxID=2749147 RepID=UPI00188F8944|nr:hypothetical protein [Aliidiomarina indica]
MSCSKELRGFGLISIIIAMLAIMTAALAYIGFIHQRIQQQHSEALVETLHRTRLSAVHYFQTYGIWPNRDELTRLTHVGEYVLDVEVRYSPSYLIRVLLPNAERSHKIQSNLPGTVAQGPWLDMQMPTADTLESLATSPFLMRWPLHSAAPSVMQTDLAMRGHHITDAGMVAAGEIWSRGWQSEGAEATATQASLSELNSVATLTLTNTQLHGNHGSIGELRGNGGVFMGVDVAQQLQARFWQQAQLQSNEMTGGQGDTRLLMTQVTDAEAWQGMSLESQNLSSHALQLDSLQSHFSNVDEIHAEQWQSQALISLASDASNVQTVEALLSTMTTARELYVQHGVGDVLDTHLQSAIGLYQQLDACWYGHGWCRPAEIPELSSIQCVDCTQTAAEGLFQGRVEFHVGTCLHGCRLTIDADWATQATCVPNTIDIAQSGHGQCAFERFLSAGERLSEVATIAVSSDKNVSVKQVISADIDWHTPLQCQATNFMFAIQGANPEANGLITLPLTDAGMMASNEDVGGINCNRDYHFSHWRCSVSGFCSEQGTWQQVSGECICNYAD